MFKSDPARRGGLALVMILTLATVANATIWIVDANNGPGANFSTITAALAVAVPGDRILVRNGNYYENVAVTSGITIVGWNATQYPMVVPTSITAAIHGQVSVQNVPAGQTAVLSGLIIARPGSGSGLCLGVSDCAGPVVLDRLFLTNGSGLISNATNVIIEEMRIRHLYGGVPAISGMFVVNSWVQANDLDSTGGDLYGDPGYYPAAGAALEVGNNSIVALARPKLSGGTGGGPWTTSPSTPAGGPAIRAFGGGIVSIADDPSGLNYLVGGQGGYRGVGSASSIPAGNGGNTIEIDTYATVINKKPMPLFAGQAGANLAGGPAGAPGTGAFTASGGLYGPIVDTPALFRFYGSTLPNGVLLMSHLAAAPGYPVGLAMVTEFDLSIYAPSLQFLSGNPASAIFLSYGYADAARYYQVGFTLPPTFGGLVGGSVLVQAADDVVGYLFLANPGVLVLGF